MFSDEIHATEPLPPTVAMVEGDGTGASLNRHGGLNFYPAKIWFFEGDHLGQPMAASPAAEVIVELRPRSATALMPDALEQLAGAPQPADCAVYNGAPPPPPSLLPQQLPYSSSMDRYTLLIQPSIAWADRDQSAVEVVALDEIPNVIEGAEEFGLEIVSVTITDTSYTGRPVVVGSDHTMFRWLILDNE